MFILLKNNRYELAIKGLLVKEIMKRQEILNEGRADKFYGEINFRGTNIPISVLENHKPVKGIFLVIQNSNGLGCIWVDEVLTAINKDFEVKSIELSGKCEILDYKNTLYPIINPEVIFSF